MDAVYEGIHITGYIGKPVIARSNRNYENYFVNGRYVRSNLISKGIEEAYKPFMMQHKYPFTMLHFSIEPETLDVNVHPTKMELRFSDGEYVFKRTVEAVGEALAHRELIPEVVLDETERKREEAARKRREERAPQRPEPFEKQRRNQLEAANSNSRPESRRETSYGSPGQTAHPPVAAAAETAGTLSLTGSVIPDKTKKQDTPVPQLSYAREEVPHWDQEAHKSEKKISRNPILICRIGTSPADGSL